MLPPEFVAAIRSAPADDAVRLVAADWFEEHGDPERAEFIRVQCAIAEAIGSPADEEAAFDAHMLRRAVESGEPPSPDDPPAQLLMEREHELLTADRTRWFTDAIRLHDSRAFPFTYWIRRGFLDAAALPTSAFLAHAADVLAACPALSELTLYGPRGQGEALAAAAAFDGIERVELAGWLDADDALALARSAYLSGCRTLCVWVGHRDQTAVVEAIARGPAFANVRELVLLQLYGGLAAGDEAAMIDGRADELAARANAVRGEPFARVERPFARRFPLRGDVGYGIYAGHLSGGRPVVLVFDDRPVLLHFTPDGRFAGEERLDLPASVGDPSSVSWRNLYDAAFERQVMSVIGFEPGVIFVREFLAPATDLSVYQFGAYEDIIADPDAPRRPTEDAEEQIGSSLCAWRERGDFVILYGNDYWAGPDGQIHSS